MHHLPASLCILFKIRDSNMPGNQAGTWYCRFRLGLRLFGGWVSGCLFIAPSACFSDGNQPWRFKFAQASSTLCLLIASLVAFPSDVDRLYLWGIWANFIISFLFHGTMPSNGTRIECGYAVETSRKDMSRPIGRVAVLVDRTVVCFLNFYIACRGYGIPTWAVVLICLLAACSCLLGGHLDNMGNGAICFVSVMMIGYKVVALPIGLQLQFWIAAAIAPFPFLIIDCSEPKGWSLPTRWVWHFCCAVLLSVYAHLSAM